MPVTALAVEKLSESLHEELSMWFPDLFFQRSAIPGAQHLFAYVWDKIGSARGSQQFLGSQTGRCI